MISWGRSPTGPLLESFRKDRTASHTNSSSRVVAAMAVSSRSSTHRMPARALGCLSQIPIACKRNFGSRGGRGCADRRPASLLGLGFTDELEGTFASGARDRVACPLTLDARGFRPQGTALTLQPFRSYVWLCRPAAAIAVVISGDYGSKGLLPTFGPEDAVRIRQHASW